MIHSTKKAKKSERGNVVQKGLGRDSRSNPSNFEAFKTSVTPNFLTKFETLYPRKAHIII